MEHNSSKSYEQALSLAKSNPCNLKEALEILNTSSKDGDLRSRYALATWYLSGNDVVVVNIEMGINMLLTLSDSNIAEAHFDLAVAYDLGNGLEQNDEMAFNHYMISGLLGDCEACSQISQFYREGKVVHFSEILSEFWEKRSKSSEKDISPSFRLWLS